MCCSLCFPSQKPIQRRVIFQRTFALNSRGRGESKRMAERGPLDDVSDFVNGIPPLTRYTVFTTLALSLSLQFGLVSPQQVILQLKPIIGSAEVRSSAASSSRGQTLSCALFRSIVSSQTCVSLQDLGSSCTSTFCVRISHSSSHRTLPLEKGI